MRRSALWPNTIGLSEAGRASPEGKRERLLGDRSSSSLSAREVTMAHHRILAAGAVLIWLGAGVLHAQGYPGAQPAILPGAFPPGAAVNRPPVTPLIGTSRLGVSVARPAEVPAGLGRANAALAASLRHRGPGVALMIVGGAGLVTGLLVEEPIITVVGAGVGLYGLYLYLR